MAYNSKYTGLEVEELLDSIDNKQNKLIAGEGIDITDNVISATIDNELFKVVDTLPDEPDNEDKGKIFIIRDPESASDSNQFIEYIWIGSWEEFGRFQAEIDFEGYYTKEEIDAMMLNYETKEDLSTLLEDYTTLDYLSDNYQEKLKYYIETLGSQGQYVDDISIGYLGSPQFQYARSVKLYTAMGSNNSYVNETSITMQSGTIFLSASTISLSLGSNLCSANLSSNGIVLTTYNDRKAYYNKNGNNSSEIATLSDLEGYVATSDLSNYVTETALSSILEEYTKTSDIADTYLEKLIYYRESNNNGEVMIGNYSVYTTNCHYINLDTDNGSMTISSNVNIDASVAIKLNTNKAYYNSNEIATVKDLEGYILTSDIETVTTEEIDALFE